MQIDFYTLATTSRTEFIDFAKRLVRQIYYKNLSVFILADSVAELHRINDALWDLDESDFLPHNFVNATTDAQAPVAFLQKAQAEQSQEQLTTIQAENAENTQLETKNLTKDLNFIELGIYQDLKAKDVCINLSTTSLVAVADKFTRIVEISLEEEEYLAAKREIWLSYKSANFKLKHHKIS